jgi:hypothetical protein
MKNVSIYSMEVKRKRYIILFGLCIPLMIVVNHFTHEKLSNGYQFFLFFFSILSTVFVFDLIMLKAIKEDATQSPNPFYLMKYVGYTFLILFSSGPFIYLWSMRELIAQLKW